VRALVHAIYKSLFLKTFPLDEEVKAVGIISAALRENPQSYTLLHVQCDFLRSKGKTEWAAKLARQAVNCAPSEFMTWAKLTEVYLELGMLESVGLIAPFGATSQLIVSLGSSHSEFVSYVHIQRTRSTPYANPRTNTSTHQAIYRRLKYSR
jgi:predicted Zn-dependent protease